MTEPEKDQIGRIIGKAPRSVWGYWNFAVPAIMALVGIGFQLLLLHYFKTTMPGWELCLKHGPKVVAIGDSEVVGRFVLTTSFLITSTFGLLALLARAAYQQIRLLRVAAKELGVYKEGRQ